METNLDSFYKKDESLEKTGVWFQVSETTKFRVKRLGGSNSKKVQQALAKYHKPYSRLIENNSIDPQLLKMITAQAFVEACMLDWTGVVIDGKEVSYDPEVAVDFFVSLPDLLDDLWAYSSDGANYKVELGNS